MSVVPKIKMDALGPITVSPETCVALEASKSTSWVNVVSSAITHVHKILAKAAAVPSGAGDVQASIPEWVLDVE